MARYPYPVEFSVKTVNNQETMVMPTADLEIDRANLTREMSRQPGLYAYYAALAEEEYRRGKRIKFKLHCLAEDLDKKYRKELTPTTGKRITERELSNKIKAHAVMRSLYASYVKTMRRAGHLKVIKDAFEQRHALLQSIGAMQRREVESEIRTLQRKIQSKSR